MQLARTSHNWNSTEDTPEFTGIPPHIVFMPDIEGLKREIKSLKGKVINQLQYDMEKRGFYSMEHNAKTIIDVME